MKDYIVLLRGINISGKNKVNMSILKEQLQLAQFKNVYTYLNSGNILLSTSKSIIKIQEIITNLLYEQFGLSVPMIIIETSVIEDYLAHAPSWWNEQDKNLYHQMIFVLGDYKANEIYEMIGEPELEGEHVEVYKHMLFWSFPKDKYQKSKWWKQTASPLITPNLTIRKGSTIINLLKYKLQ